MDIMAPDKSTANSPTRPSAKSLDPTLERNISALLERRREAARSASAEEKIAAAISRFAGSMIFVYLHIAFFAAWILANAIGLPFLPRWDPSLVILAMLASVEAIFLSTFVLINQNQMAANDDLRADLHLQVGLLNEHETTKLIVLVDSIAKHLGIRTEVDAELAELKRDVAPDAVLDRIESSQKD